MNYRYQEILTWIIPGFFLLVAIGFIWCFSNEGITSCITNGSTEKLAQTNPFYKYCIEFLLPKASASFWNAIAAVLIFLIPIMSLLVGWIINAIGGFIMKRRFIRKFFLLLVKGCPESDGKNKSDNEKSPDIVGEYKECIKSFDPQKLEQLDRFYYRYVFSRNLVTAQLVLIVTTYILLHSHPCIYNCRVIMTEWCMAFAFLLIMIRDFRTHVSFVFSWKERFCE